MVNFGPLAAEIRQGKKKEWKKKKPQGKDIMSASATQGGHDQFSSIDAVICFPAGSMNLKFHLTLFLTVLASFGRAGYIDTSSVEELSTE